MLSPMARRVVASLLWQGGAAFFSQVISWLATLVVIRLLSPSDYGLMAMAGVFVGFLMMVGDLGVGAVVVQAPALIRTQLEALFSVGLLAYILAALITFAAAPVAAAFFADPRLIPIVRALSLNFVFAGVYAVPQALLLRTLEFDRKAKIDVLATLVSSIVAFVLALDHRGAWSLVGAALAGHAFRAVAFQIVRPCLSLRFAPFAVPRDMVRFGGLFTVARVLWFGYTNFDIAIVGRALGDSIVGVYSVAASLASIPLDKVMPIVAQVSFSAVSRTQGDREGLRRGLLLALESVSVLAFPTFFGMATVAPEAFAVFLGPKWAVAVIPFQILCLTFLCRTLGALFAPALFGTGRPLVVVENNAITLGIVASALIIGVQWGIVGICVGWLLGYIPVFYVTARRTLAKLDIPVGQAVAVLGVPLASTLTMCVGVVASRILLANALPPAALLVTVSLLGAGIYGALTVTFRPQALRSMRKWGL